MYITYTTIHVYIIYNNTCFVVYQRQIQQAIQKCNVLIDKNTSKYLTNIKPIAPKINAYIKTHKENEPIRPVIDNTQAPSYNITKFFNNRPKNYINLPDTSQKLARNSAGTTQHSNQRKPQNNHSRFKRFIC